MRPTFFKAALGGFVGTLAMTMIMYLVAPMMGMPKMDIAANLGDMMGAGWTVGMMIHFMNGTVIFPLLFALVLYRWLPGSPAAKGASWGAVLWLLAQTMVMPMIGAGFFSSKMGMMAAVGSLVSHLIYGTLLGVISGAPKEAEARQPQTA